MPRPQELDATKILELHQQGLNPEQIARRWAEIFLKGKTPRKINSMAIRKILKRAQQTESNGHNDLDNQIDLTIAAFQALKERPLILKELEKYKRGYENAVATMKRDAELAKKHKDKELRFKLAKQQGEIPSSTEHILGRILWSAPNSTLPPYVTIPVLTTTSEIMLRDVTFAVAQVLKNY